MIVMVITILCIIAWFALGLISYEITVGVLGYENHNDDLALFIIIGPISFQFVIVGIVRYIINRLVDD